MSGALLPFMAVVAGLVSVTSPCCLPLLPGYISYVSSVAPTAEGLGPARSTAVRAAVLFVVGFALVFTVLGAAASSLGNLLLANLPTITRVAGVFIIAMGLATIGVFRLPLLAREFRFDLGRLRRGPAGAVPLGMAFAFGWTPCIGPVLAVILGLAASSGSVLVGAALLALYSLGLGLPFVALAAGVGRVERSLGFLRRHGVAVERVGGVFLVLVGVGYVTDTWSRLFIPLQGWFADFGWPPI